MLGFIPILQTVLQSVLALAKTFFPRVYLLGIGKLSLQSYLS